MNDTQTQIERLIELAIVQRSELKQLVSELPQLREHLNAEIERTFEETEPQIRTELEEFCRARATDEHAKTGAALTAKVEQLSKQLEVTTAAKYSVLMAERAENATLLANAEARIADAAQAIPSQVKAIVSDELSRFPRAGEIDQLRKEFAEPRGLNPRGRWQIGETYNKLDLVSYNGDSYVSNTDGNREKPSRSSEAWTLSAARGNGGGGGGATSLTDLVPVPANGELLIGNGSAFVNNTLTAGTGVTITNGPGSITIDASGAQELLTATVTNAESFAITRGQVVYLFGATGNRASVKLADNSSDAASSKTFGVVSDASIAANGVGLITCMGVVDGLSLGAYSAGDVLYLGNTPGSVTVTKPYAPNHLVYVGMVERANNGNGELYVRIQNGYELDEIHDVQITSAPLAGSLLMRDATNSLWKANRLTGTSNQVTVTNADTAVTLSLPTAIANVNSVTAQSATNLTLAGGSTSGQILFNSPSATERARLTTTGNLLIGTTTDISGTGGLHVAGTDTATSSSNGGALRVGTNVAMSGNAGGASYFGGAATFAGAVSVVTTGLSTPFIVNSTSANIATAYQLAGATKLVVGVSAANDGLVNGSVLGDPVFRTAGNILFSTDDGTTAALKLTASTGAATFAGAVTVNAISGINALAAGTQLATFESSVNGAAVELIAKGKNSVGTARQANMGINRFADDVWSLSNGTTEHLRVSLTTSAATFAGTVIAPAATTALAPMRIPHGTAPTSPVNGDMWTTTAGLFVRINGVTVGPLS